MYVKKQTQYSQNRPNLSSEQHDQISAAARILCEGGTVAFPTETVYGLGADVTNPYAVNKIYTIKQRPTDHPLIVHIGNISHLQYWAQAIPEFAWKLASHFWPGPLTLILQRSRHISDRVTGGQDTVGLRIPAHPVALALLNALGPDKALAAPSANRFGKISPTTAAHVREELGSKVDMILDGGACEIGLESTIISFHDQLPAVLRPGGIALSALESVLDSPIIVAHNVNQAVRTSGSLPAHYAPATPLKIYSTAQIEKEATTLAAQSLRVLIIRWSDIDKSQLLDPLIQQFFMPQDPISYGKQLYARLHEFDQAAFDYILVEAPPDHPAWLAITDRLQRASYHHLTIT
ncbi:L-threonylcarbamoyladenylate synthase [Nitrosomonas sp. Nm166]|uniref:L-threonylcarbamoyladenylate synthase n=1 Tax=Nitrosomonas sp. Nm166 TaxID=1881054 RepID=UPI0008E719E7|nr:L-threonylcarbamoyladenylate synthase [Nitrosomonas sp. Nm166]SFE77870.1 L-threonylcarbamoyladenylate synthase [Nitrosomonas sp. Nm166]